MRVPGCVWLWLAPYCMLLASMGASCVQGALSRCLQLSCLRPLFRLCQLAARRHLPTVLDIKRHPQRSLSGIASPHAALESVSFPCLRSKRSYRDRAQLRAHFEECVRTMRQSAPVAARICAPPYIPHSAGSTSPIRPRSRRLWLPRESITTHVGSSSCAALFLCHPLSLPSEPEGV